MRCPGELRTLWGRGEREREIEIQGGNEQPWVWALFTEAVGILGHVIHICVSINPELSDHLDHPLTLPRKIVSLSLSLTSFPVLAL